MNKFLLAAILCCSIFLAQAQKKSNPTPEDISLAQDYKAQFEEDEKIVILAKNYEVSFEKRGRKETVGVVVTERTTYFNISQSAKLQHGVFYDAGSKIEEFKVENRRGKEVYAPVQDEYLMSEDLFHTDYRVQYINVSLPLQGYTTTVETTLAYDDIKYFTTTYFADQYRIIDGSMNFTIPSWLSYDIREFNFDGFEVASTSMDEKGDKVISYSFNNIAPRSTEALTPGPSFVYPHIIFIAKSFENGGTRTNLFNSVEDLYGWYSSLVNDVEVITTDFEDTVQELTAGKNSDEERMSAIYYWVQDNIRYVAFEDGIAGFKPDSPQNVFNKKYGDCKGMAILTKSMLEVAGFDSRLVWIGTDRLAYDYTTPSLSVDNHMICAVQVDNDYLFLDGTEKFGRLGDTASRIQFKEAMIENGDSFEIIKVPSNNSTTNYEQTTYNLTVDGDKLTGSVIKAFEGESRVSFQNSFYSLGSGDQDKILAEYLASGNDNYTVDNLGFFNARSREETIILNYEVEINNVVSSFDNMLYLDIDPFKRAGNLVFEERKIALKLPLLEKEVTSINVSIPDGYALDTMPAAYFENNELVEIALSYEKQGDQIVFKKSILPKKRTINVVDFDLWNQSFEGLKKASSEQLTFIKKS